MTHADENRIGRLTFRRALRARLTPVEASLWNALKGRQVDGFAFRRQFSVGPYIVDFYCPAARLAIELDGAPHDHVAAQTFDDARTAYLETHRIRVLRFINDDVRTNRDGVVDAIRIALQTPPLSRAAR